MSKDPTEASLSKEIPLSEQDKHELYLYSLKKVAEEKVDANRIKLTNLLNIRAFYYLCGEIQAAHPEHSFGVMIFDIANFKMVNEFCGRSEGDQLLVHVADCFRAHETPLTAIAHFRADTFAMLLPYTSEQDFISIVKTISAQIDLYPLTCKVLPAFGIYMDGTKHTPVSLMCDYAMMALKTIKGKVFTNYAIFDEGMKNQMLLEKQIENRMIAGLENQEFQVYIQPKVNMMNSKIIGGEALVRWQHPDFGFIRPDKFMSVFEKNGFVINLDLYVWTQVFCYMAEWKKAGYELLPISVNVSRLHAYDKVFCSSLCDMAVQYDIDPHYVLLELTESAFLENAEQMFHNMAILQAKGFSFSMDDFGSGYSSMNMLKSQPVDEIKIDREFLSNINDTRSQIIIRNTIRMIQELDISLIVEGVETEEQQNFLLSCGCTKAQGFLYYKPMPAKDFAKIAFQRAKP